MLVYKSFVFFFLCNIIDIVFKDYYFKMSGVLTTGSSFSPQAGLLNIPTGNTLLHAFNTYVNAPTSGTIANIALGADNLALGYKTVTPPSNGAIIQGNVGLGQSTAATQLDCLGTVQTTGKSFVSESVTTSTALSTTKDSLVDSRAGALSCTLADGTVVDQIKNVCLAFRRSAIASIACSRGSFNLTPAEPARRLRFTADGWVVDEAYNSSAPDSFYPTAQAASITSYTTSTTSVLFGIAIAISADGLTAAIGGSGDSSSAGAVWIFTRATNTSTWTQQGAKLVGTNVSGTTAQQGKALALSADGNTLAVGCPNDNSNAGCVIIWTRNTSTNVWTQQGSAIVGTGGTGTTSRQGTSVSLSADGNILAFGGPTDNTAVGRVWVWTRSSGTWSQQQTFTPSGVTGSISQAGTSVSLSADGATIAIGAPNDNSNVGGTWIWTRAVATWSQQQGPLVGSGGSTGQQGNSVSLSADGATVAIGGSQDNSAVGGAWIFTRNGTVWTQQGLKLLGTGATGSAAQGTVVALSPDGNVLILSGTVDDSSKGAVWTFIRSGNIWSQQGSKLTATGVAASDLVGSSIAIGADGQVVLVGARGKTSSTGQFLQFS